jgi:hypothetical protein
VFAATDEAALTKKLLAADIAFARVNNTAALAQHPHLRRIRHRHAVGAGIVSGAGGASRIRTILRAGASAGRTWRAHQGRVHGKPLNRERCMIFVDETKLLNEA